MIWADYAPHALARWARRHRVSALGVDAVTTDDPAALRARLAVAA